MFTVPAAAVAALAVATDISVWILPARLRILSRTVSSLSDIPWASPPMKSGIQDS